VDKEDTIEFCKLSISGSESRNPLKEFSTLQDSAMQDNFYNLSRMSGKRDTDLKRESLSEIYLWTRKYTKFSSHLDLIHLGKGLHSTSSDVLF